ncbi:MAG: tRNA (guanine37-N1)-methyltransferase [Candidatus Methanomethylophilaceae archaeon]|nr:tRNA (guanine37-N1)-methyltransferase [Candidatus Methanomethylophilaceae archaeon]
MGRCIKVPLKDGENIRRKLKEDGLLDRTRSVVVEGDHLLIPVEGNIEGYETLERDLPPLNCRETNYRRMVDVPGELVGLLPTSYDLIGDLAVIKLEERLLPYAEELAEAIMKANPRLRSVALDHGVKGEMRVRDLEILRGENKTATLHTEFGVTMEVDPSLVYFNPRLANERKRVADMVLEGELIADMFAGVGPFPLVICRHARPRRIYAIDINPEAVRIMERNIRRNKFQEIIVPILGDAREEMRSLPPLDRIIMNLPQMADEFLDSALSALKVGGVIHLYRILERDALEGFQDSLVSRAASWGFIISLETVRELKTYSPTMSVYSFDVKLIALG